MRKLDLINIFLIITIAILVSNSACKKEETVGEEYTIPIDSIMHPDTISVGEKLSIQYYGILGLSDCFAFHRFELNFDAENINTYAIGLYVEDEDCKEDTAYLIGEEAHVYDLPEGDYTIIVNQPRGTFLESKVHVKTITN